MADHSSNDICGRCGSAATSQCAHCHNIKYCGKECQKKDWFSHKHLCKTFDQFASSPSPGIRRVIVLPQDSKAPYFAWVKTESADTGHPPKMARKTQFYKVKDQYAAEPDPPGYEVSDFSDIFGPKPTIDSYRNLAFRNIQRLDHTINAVQDRSPSLHNREINQCLQHLSRGQAASKLDRYGAGTYVLFAKTKVHESRFMRDADCSDLTLGVEAILANPDTTALWNLPKPGEMPEISVVLPTREEDPAYWGLS